MILLRPENGATAAATYAALTPPRALKELAASVCPVPPLEIGIGRVMDAAEAAAALALFWAFVALVEDAVALLAAFEALVDAAEADPAAWDAEVLALLAYVDADEAELDALPAEVLALEAEVDAAVALDAALDA
jgi:hypothetical protein